MLLQIAFQPYHLDFKKQAGTSRGVLTQKVSWVIQVWDQDHPEVRGMGECGPLPGLSVDDVPDFEMHLQAICEVFNSLELEVYPYNLNIILQVLVPDRFPSIRFGIEMAILDLMNGGKGIYFKNAFSSGTAGIPMNGLIWMGSFEDMLEQVKEKLEEGYTTIKLKIGAIDFEQECRILAFIRAQYDANQITLRVDANGAFSPAEAMYKLGRLAAFELHSIEQPIKAGQPELMAELCKTSPVSIALDEELIGYFDYRHKMALLKQIQPPYIILKPTLLGGFQHTKEWIEIAERLGIDWWITSALESNIGLAAIAQFTAMYNNPLPQGLGTGKLYFNNVDSPLRTDHGFLHYDQSGKWDFSVLNQN